MSLVDLLTRQKVMESYLNKTPELARKLVLSNGNLDIIRDELKRNSTDDFLKGIIDNDAYEPFVLSMADSVIEQHEHVREEVENARLGISKPKRIMKKRTITKKTIVSKTKSGKVYKRSFKNWSSKDEQFIKSRLRKGKSKKVIIAQFLEQTDSTRSNSSIETKLYRLKKEMN